MKILNFIIGLAIVIVLSGLFTLGVRAFYLLPEPPARVIISSPPDCSYWEEKEKCAEELKTWEKRFDITTIEYRSLVEKYNKEVDEYEQKVKTHNRNIFIIGNIAGILFFIAGFILIRLPVKTALAVGIGIILSGLYAIIMGYSVGWNSADDRLKFFIGLIIAVILIGGSLLIGKRWKNKLTDKDNIQFPPSIPPRSTV